MSERSDQTRRDFLKNSAVIAAGAVAASQLASVPSVFAAGDDTIKVALIGCGGRGSGACSQALSTKGPVKLVAVADAFEDNAKKSLARIKQLHPDRVDVKDDHVFWGFDAYKKAIDAGADLIIIATPPGFRPIHFEYAVKAGKNVFAEKPIATDAGGVRRFLAAAEEAKQKNLKIGIGLQRHHQTQYLETIKRLHDGIIGTPVLLRMYWNGTTPWVRPRKPEQTEMEYQMRNWYFFNWLCGDHINEQHIHNLDVANWIMKGHPVEAQGCGGRQVRTGIDNGEIYDHHMIEYTYADGTKMQSMCRHQQNTWMSVSEHAHGTKGYADVSGAAITVAGQEPWHWHGEKADPYQVEHDDLFEAIRSNKPYNETEYGAHSTMTAILGRMASYSGQLIKWDNAINAQTSIMPTEFDYKATPPTTPDKDGRYPIPMPGMGGDATVCERVNKEIMSWGGGGAAPKKGKKKAAT